MTAFNRFQYCQDVATLRPGLNKFCEKFGNVTWLDVLMAVHQGVKQAICFLRLESPKKEELFMHTLRMGRFDGEIAFVVDIVDPGGHGPQEPPALWGKFGAVPQGRLEHVVPNGAVGQARTPVVRGSGLMRKAWIFATKDAVCAH